MKKHTLAFVDLETTGLDPFQSEIIEIGIVLAEQVTDEDGRPTLTLLSEHNIALVPEHIETANAESLKICKYHDRDWSHAVTQKEGLQKVAELLTGKVFVGQNVAFDWGFLQKSCHEHAINLDELVHYHKLDLASMTFGKFYREQKLFRFSLREMVEFFGVVNQDAHTALADARATFEVCKKVLEA